MAFTRGYKRFTYKDDPAWEAGSFWRFRTDLSDVDDDVATEIITESILSQVPSEEIDRVRREGRDVNAYLRSRLTRRDVVNGKRAFLVAKSVAWGGVDHMIPVDYQDEHQEAIGEDERGEPIFPLHEDAGNLAPINAYWVGQEEPEVIDRVYAALMAKLQGRSPEEEAAFRGGGDRVDGPGDPEVPEDEAPETA